MRIRHAFSIELSDDTYEDFVLYTETPFGDDDTTEFTLVD